jgi:hypothetical protein
MYPKVLYVSLLFRPSLKLPKKVVVAPRYDNRQSTSTVLIICNITSEEWILYELHALMSHLLKILSLVSKRRQGATCLSLVLAFFSLWQVQKQNPLSVHLCKKKLRLLELRYTWGPALCPLRSPLCIIQYTVDIWCYWSDDCSLSFIG